MEPAPHRVCLEDVKSKVLLLDFFQLSSLLSLFDRFTSPPWVQLQEYSPVSWDLSNANEFEKLFFKASHTRLVSLLSQINLKLICEDVVVSLPSITHSILLDLIAFISDLIENPPNKQFDYVNWIQTILQTGINCLHLIHPFIKTHGLLSKGVRASPICPEPLGSGMAEHEVSFSAAGTKIIIFPNPNEFTSEHKALWELTACRPNRVLRDYILNSTIILHELIHVVQYRSMGPTTDKNIWQKEYMACHAQLNVLFAIKKYAPDFFHEGYVEEVVLWTWENVKYLHECGDFKNDIFEGYAKWKKSAGREDPFDVDAMDLLASERKHAFYVKTRLAIESFDEGNSFRSFMNACFAEDRSKELVKRAPSSPLGMCASPQTFSNISKRSSGGRLQPNQENVEKKELPFLDPFTIDPCPVALQVPRSLF